MFAALALISALVWAAVLVVTAPSAFRAIFGVPRYEDAIRLLLCLLASNRVIFSIIETFDPPQPEDTLSGARFALRIFSLLLGGLALHILRRYEKAGL